MYCQTEQSLESPDRHNVRICNHTIILSEIFQNLMFFSANSRNNVYGPVFSESTVTEKHLDMVENYLKPYNTDLQGHQTFLFVIF